MNSIHFKPNEPQTLSLKETAGVIDGFSVLYETWDGRLLSLPRPAAVKLNELDPAPGEEAEFLQVLREIGLSDQEAHFCMTSEVV